MGVSLNSALLLYAAGSLMGTLSYFVIVIFQLFLGSSLGKMFFTITRVILIGYSTSNMKILTSIQALISTTLLLALINIACISHSILALVIHGIAVTISLRFFLHFPLQKDLSAFSYSFMFIGIVLWLDMVITVLLKFMRMIFIGVMLPHQS